MTSLFEKPVEIIAPVEISLDEMPPLVSLFEAAPFYRVRGVRRVQKQERRDGFDSDLLSDIVFWAWLDSQDLMRDYARYDGWGSWNQESWARFDTYALQDRAPHYEGERPQGSCTCGACGEGSHARLVDRDLARHPECESAFCIAGQVAVQRGMVLVADPAMGWAQNCAPPIKDDQGRRVRDNAGNVKVDYDQEQAIWQFAMTELGLTYAEQSLLFEGDNRIEVIVSLACLFARRYDKALLLPQEVLDLDMRLTEQHLRHHRDHGYYFCDPEEAEAYERATCCTRECRNNVSTARRHRAVHSPGELLPDLVGAG